jgi:hypothetical protein
MDETKKVTFNAFDRDVEIEFSERSFLQRIESSRLAATQADRGRIFLK